MRKIKFSPIGLQWKMIMCHSIIVVVIITLAISLSYAYVLYVSAEKAEINRTQISQKVIMQIEDNLDNGGDIQELENKIHLEILEDITIFLFDSNGEQLFPNDLSFEDAVDKHSFITTNQSEKYAVSITLLQNRTQMIQPYKHMVSILFCGGIGIFFSLLAAIYFTAHYFSSPITHLAKKVQNISFEDIPTVFDGDSSISEIQELRCAFTSMFQRLQDSLEAEKRSYMLALQSQMDPHFLYNTLATISSMVIEQNNDSAVEACNILSEMLRYTSTIDTHSATLADEVENTSNYLKLMKLRYEHFFTYTIDIDQSLLFLPVPRLMLQPFVENCFDHGFKPVKPPWKIYIKGRLKEDIWELSIYDNGVGMSDNDRDLIYSKIEDYIANITKKYREMKFGGMGFANTIARLKLMSNGVISYSINQGNPGTIVTLRGRINL